LKELRASLESEDKDKIKRLSEDLQNAFHALSQQLYAAQNQQPSPSASSNGRNDRNGHNPGEDQGEVIEGEFHEA
jgi:hypothetical protein